MEEAFWELLFATNTTANHILKLDERHCGFLDQYVDILEELSQLAFSQHHSYKDVPHFSLSFF